MSAIISKILSYFGSIKLTLEQFTLIALTTAVGALVVALKVQGSRLHKLEVQMLETNIHSQDQADTKAVKDAYDVWFTAYNSYLANGGK